MFIQTLKIPIFDKRRSQRDRSVVYEKQMKENSPDGDYLIIVSMLFTSRVLIFSKLQIANILSKNLFQDGLFSSDSQLNGKTADLSAQQNHSKYVK